MSRGVNINTDHLDSNQQPQLLQSSQSNSPSTTPAVPTSSTSSDQPSPTNEVSVNGDRTTNQLSENDLERSPGPHMEEMTNGAEGEDDFSEMDESVNFMNSEEMVEVGNFDPDLRRVKVYELVGSRWTDRGTAFCQGEFDNDSDEARLIAKSELTHDVLLNCLIRVTDVYQRQQDTLIVWTEPDGTDFALSFQDIEGCSEVWEFIVEVQKHLNNRGTPVWTYDDPGVRSVFSGSDDSTSTLFSEFSTAIPNTAAQIIQSGHLPVPTTDAGFILEIEKALRTMARVPKTRDSICSYILEHKYIYQLRDSFEMAESGENLDALHALCSCMQTILLFSEHQMYDHILSDDLWMGAVGMLEYDPEFPKFKANYREYLQDKTKFLQPIPIMNELVQTKIHNTYKLQYLKDVILGRALDDSTFNVLNSCIIFNQIEIITHVQQDEQFLSNLVSLFIQQPNTREKSPDTMTGVEPDSSVDGAKSPVQTSSSSSSKQTNEQQEERKKQVISLLQQLCVMGKNVQLPARIGLFRVLIERGVLYAVQWALCSSEKHLIIAAGEILSVLLDHSTLNVRHHVVVQAVALGQSISHTNIGGTEQTKFVDVTNGRPPFKETLMQVLCRLMANSQDLALQNQLADALRLICDTPPLEGLADQAGMGSKLLAKPRGDDHITTYFLANAYSICVETLVRPLIIYVPDHRELKDPVFLPSRDRANLYLYLCDLICSFIQQHGARSVSFFTSSGIIGRIASFLYARDKHLCLVALRFFRHCLRIRMLYKVLIKNCVYTPIIKLTLREAKRENLLSSACQEFFEHIRKENLKDIIDDVMVNHEAEVRDLAKSSNGAVTFQGLITRHEINSEQPPVTMEKKQPVTTVPRVFGHVIEAEAEEDYLLGDDNEEDQIVPVPRADSALLDIFRKKRQRLAASNADSQANKSMRLSNTSQQRPPSPFQSLWGYNDEEDAGSDSPSDKASSTQGAPQGPHRQIEILPYEPSDPSDPEDDLLEELVSKKADESPKSEAPSIKLREKRRRGEEDEEDVFEKLVPKNRRLSNASEEASQAAAAKARSATSSPKSSEEGSKKLKLKFSMSRLLGGDKSSSPSKTDSKDGGNG